MRVNTLTFENRGDATGVHIHAFDYLVVPISGGDLKVVRPDGTESETHQEPGKAYTGVIGTTHNVISDSDKPVIFVEIEFKSV